MRDVLKADILVVGAGIAGLTAAVTAKEANPDLRVVLADKSVVGRSGASVKAKAMAAVGDWSFKDDSPERHLEDIINAGCQINDIALADQVVRGAAKMVSWVERLGMPFDEKRAESHASPRQRTVGHSYYRSLHFRDLTGKLLLDTLRRQANRDHILMLNDSFVTRLIAVDGCVCGALAIAQGSGKAIVSSATILATGGIGYLYSRTTNPPQMTGDGILLAYDAGAELMDMEMVQFHPMNYIYPQALEGKNAGKYYLAKLYNAKGERFMMRYEPESLENTTRDRLSQAIVSEIRAGRATPQGGVFIDRSDLTDKDIAQLRNEVKIGLAAGLDIRSQRGEITPAAHYFMGGIRVNKQCQATLGGLYAAGESVAGVHGANRLADNSLTDTLVLGQIAGAQAAEFCSAQQYHLNEKGVHQFISRFSFDSSTSETRRLSLDDSAPRIKRRLRDAMWQDVGVVRADEGLRGFLRESVKLREHAKQCLSSAASALERVDCLEAGNMVALGELIARAALFRTESRGAHFREDFPEQDDQDWTGNTIIRRSADGLTQTSLFSRETREHLYG